MTAILMRVNVLNAITLCNMELLLVRTMLLISATMFVPIATTAQSRIDSLLNKLKISSREDSLAIHLLLSYEYDDVRSVLYHAKSANRLAKRQGDSLSIVQSGRLVGWSYRKLNYLDSSINACEQVLSIAKRNKYMLEYGKLLNGLGMTYTFIAKYDEALKCHFESLAAMENIDNKKWVSISLVNIGLMYYKMVDTRRALDYNLRALALKKKHQLLRRY